MPKRRVTTKALLLACALISAGAGAGSVHGQETYCGVTPQSARRIAIEIMNHAGNAFDSASSAYYISVLASRLSPYYVVYFLKDSVVVGEIEVDLCGRQGTPHPGIQYAPDSELKFSDLLLEPDQAFAALKARTGAEATFGSRVFPVGLTATTDELSAIDFWWLMLDTTGQWHYMNRTGQPKSLGVSPLPSSPRRPGAGD